MLFNKDTVTQMAFDVPLTFPKKSTLMIDAQNKVFCPLHHANVDVERCWSCGNLDNYNSSDHIPSVTCRTRN